MSATHEDGRLLLRVADDGPGLGPAPVVEGIGLTNTRDRLRHLFGDDFSLSYANVAGGGFAIALAFPLVVEPPAAEGDPGETPAAYGF